MDVGGAIFDSFGQQGVDQPDDGRIIVRFQQVFGFRQSFGSGTEVHVVGIEAFHLDAATRLGLIGLLQAAVELGSVHTGEPHRAAEKAAQFGSCAQRDIRAGDDIHGFVVTAIHHHAVALGKRKRRAL